MNILKPFRRPYFAMLLSSLILFMSCEQSISENAKENFDYSVYKEFSKLNFNNNNSFNKSSIITSERLRLDNINSEFNTEINFSDDFLLLIKKSPEEIEETAISNGWLNENDIYLLNEFESDLRDSNFENALQNFEENVLSLNLSENELNDKILAANALMSLNDESPGIFESNGTSWGCIRAIAALTISSVALASCATGVACALAVTAWIVSYATYLDNCDD
jgi:hypothetical protein